MKSFLLAVFALGSLQSGAQQSKIIEDPNARQRVINSSFNAVSVSDGIELYLTQGTETSLAVSVSDEKYLEKFKTDVVNGVLNIYYDNNGINWNSNNKRKLKAYLSFKVIEKLTASSGADVVAATPLNLSKLEMKFTSGSVFSGQLASNDLYVQLNTGAEIKLAGSTVKLKVDVSSGAIFKGYDFSTDYCNAKARSGGSVRISIKKELSANAISGGGIHYRGDASVIDININSGGSVKKEKI